MCEKTAEVEVEVRWEPEWNCPKCNGTTYRYEEREDWHDNGEVISVVCHHADPSDETGERECGHQYEVSLI